MSSFLSKYKRQPKLMIDLPSLGRYYPDGVLQDGQATQLPVFGMTAADEITVKTPDALFSGAATAQIISSCIPNILDPWQMPTIDIDYCLTAIRIATYGSTIPMTVKCPLCTTEQELDLNCSNLLETQGAKEFDDTLKIEDLVFKLHPITYKTQTDLNIQLYTIQRQLSEIPTEWTEEQKNETIKKLLLDAGNVNIKVMMSYIQSISDPENEERDRAEIAEFINQSDSLFFNKLKSHVEKTKKYWEHNKIDVTCSNQECKHEFKTDANLDYSSFFAPAS
tara:strand:+ start:4571 stop:5407 length:837 start_codon:yes stop_codon:yes gene_type:complete